ncbi:hypothetical protein [Micromonospora zamorensis]|uniref:YD repeat-containing protein n=1 Tax=Micromonospora zamorensis TaxID=709883 RepID=A0ABZ1PI17_9ACTN
MTADGASFDRFTSDGRPTHGTVPGSDGQPAQEVSIAYGGDGSSTWTYADGTTVDRNAAGGITREVSADGATFDGFTADGRPTHGTVPGADGQPAQDVSIAYGPDGSSTWTYADGTTVDRNAAGGITREVTADGASFDGFTADGRPTHGTLPGSDGQPAQAVDIAYGGDGSSTWSYADGTSVDRNAAGGIRREVTADGATFDGFTADGRPTHGTLPGSDGQPAQAVDIAYGGDGSSTWTYADGTKVDRDAVGGVTREVSADGASFDRFTGDGKPTHGTVPGSDGQLAQEVDIAYGGDGSSTWTYADGTKVDRDAAGDVTREVSADGASFDGFTADGKPTHGTVPGADGQPAQEVSIAYGGDGSSTWTYADGTTVDRNAAGDVTREVSADGASFDRFTADGRPTHGTVPGADGQPAQEVDIAYGGDGSSTWTYADGTTVDRSAAGGVTREVSADGATFDRFNADGKPTHGTVPGADGQLAQEVSIAYGGDGSSTWTYADGTKVDRNAAGDVTREVSADGATFDRFTPDGKPTHGTVPGADGQPAQDVSIAYGSDGSSTWTYADGTTVDRSAAGDVTREVSADGASFDRFTADGRPTHGTVPGTDGQPAQAVDITYGPDGSSTWTYADGTAVDRSAAGDVTREVTADGASFDRFNGDGKPTHGTVPGSDGQPAQDVDIAYGADGSSTWTYADGTKVDRNAAGDVTREVSADGATFDRFTPEGKPTHGTVPGADGQSAQEVSIAYGGDGSSTWTYADGTKVDRNAAGDVTREVSADGATFDRFTADGKPTHGTVPGSDGQPAQDVDIAYGSDGSSTWTYAEGTKVDRNAAGDVTREVSADGATFDRFTADGKPTHGTVPGSDGQPAQDVSITYGPDGSSTWTYADGTTVDRNAAGDVTREVSADGATFDRFTADGKPTHGTVPGSDGQPAQDVDIAYGSDGSSTWTYAEGTKVDRNAAGDVTREVSADGATFDRFTADGKPTHGTVPGSDGQPAQDVSITYGPDGSSTWTYADGTTVDRNAAGDVTREVTADGATFDRFTADGKPTHGTVPGADGQPAQDVSIAYGGDGSSTWTYADGTKVDRNAAGDVTREVSADGATFDRFNGDGKPTHGTVPGTDGQPAQAVDIAYGGDGSSTWTYADGTKVDRNPDGVVVRQTTAEGTVFDRFDGDGKPTHGTVPGTDGQPAQDVSIAYGADGSSTWTYADGTKVDRDAAGDVTREVSADGATFDRFNADGKPTHGTVPGSDGQPAQAVDIAYGGDGSSTWTYADGAKVDRNPDGVVVRQTTAEGTVFDRFNGDGKPTHGTVPGSDGQPAQAVDITYGGDGSSTWTYADGAKVDRNPDGVVVRQTTAEGTVFDRFNGDGKPTHGTVPGQGGGPGQQVDITYGADGSSVWSYQGDGSKVFSAADGTVTRQELKDGSVFDQFNGDGRPTHGTVPGQDGGPGQQVDITYGADGSSVWSYQGDGTKVYRNAEGDTTRQVLKDGTTFDQFDAEGNPTRGTAPSTNGQPAQQITITYAPDGSSTWKYGDGTTIQRNPAGVVTGMQAGGWTFDTFDGQGRPTHATEDGKNNAVDIKYAADGSSVWTYRDGTVVSRNPDGDVVLMQADGWIYDVFDGQGRPLHGSKDGKSITISYGADGLTTLMYDPKNGVVTDGNGKPVAVIVDGKRYEYAVQIPLLGESIGSLRKQRDSVESSLNAMAIHLQSIRESWNSPAGDKYEALTTDLKKLTTDTRGLLDDALTAMQKSYETYVAAEGANLKSMTAETRMTQR